MKYLFQVITDTMEIWNHSISLWVVSTF